MIAKCNNPDKLQPYVQYKYYCFLVACKKAGISICTIETLRTQARQTELHIENPKANPKYIGAHGSGLAIDVAPLKKGKIDWKDYELFKKMGEIAKSLGFVWGGDFKGVDCPHIEMKGGLTDVQLRAGMLPQFPAVPLTYQHKVYADGIIKGNGFSEEYAKNKAVFLKSKGHKNVYYTKPLGDKINI